MKFTQWQIIFLAVFGTLAFLGLAILGLLKGWIEPAWLFAPLAPLLISAVAWASHRMTVVTEQAKNEAALERARSEIPPALKDVQLVAYRPRLPSVADLSERPAEAPKPTTDVKIEVKS